jgi:broad specificity phosphatase PhoE
VAVVKRAAPLFLIVATLLTPSRRAYAQEAIYLVRHAERADQSTDSELSTDGIGRSYALRDMLHDAGITTIYTTDLRRTIATAAPFAAAARVQPVALKAADTDALIARVRAAAPRDRILIVGHSNTLPELLRAAGVTAPIDIGDNEYDNLFIVVPQKGAPPVLLRLRY